MSDRNDAGHGIAPSGYRLPAATRLGAVSLQVSDLERSLAYYEGVLGFSVLQRSDGSVALGSAADGETLVELHERPGARPVSRRGHLGLYHYAILLPDRLALGSFIAHLAKLGAAAGASDHLVSEALYLTDPDGLGIEVYADRPRSSWGYDGPQLRMATEPMNLGELVRAAGDRHWSGMPAGTRVGHVHLHVGDTAEAERLYHQALGFDKVVWNYPGALFLSAGGYHHHLGVNSWAAGAPAATEDDARLLHWEIVVPGADEAEAAARSVESAGYEVTREPSAWSVKDRWGTRLRLRGE
jgi:catechol 2,3-dioxygenase